MRVRRLMTWGASLLCAALVDVQSDAATPSLSTAPDFSSADMPWFPTTTEFGAPASGPGPVTYDHVHPTIMRQFNLFGDVVERPLQIANLDNPNLKPWVIDFLKQRNEDRLAGKIRYASRANCRPPGVPEFLIHGVGFQAIYFLQTPKEIVLINDGDRQVRHIYMNVVHSPNIVPSYFGESVGHYEGNELVVDTVGFNDRTFVDDRYSVPHTAQLHVIERFRLIQEGKMLEVDFTVDDPGAFNAPWSGVMRYRHPAEPQSLGEEVCAEETAAGFGHGYDVPTAVIADF